MVEVISGPSGGVVGARRYGVSVSWLLRARESLGRIPSVLPMIDTLGSWTNWIGVGWTVAGGA